MAIPEEYKKLAVIGIAYKGAYEPETTYKLMNAVYYEGSSYVALKDNPEGTPTSDGANWMYLAKGFIQNLLSTINAKDTYGLTGDAGREVNAQTLMDKVAEKIKNELVTNTALTSKLAEYILKDQIVNNLLATQAGNVLDAMQGKVLADRIAELNSDWINIDKYLVNGWQPNGSNLAKKVGNVYLIKIAVRYGTTTANTDIFAGLPISANALAVNCCYQASASGQAIQMVGNRIYAVNDLPSSTIFANLIASEI